MYWDLNNLYGWTMLQNKLVGSFEWNKKHLNSMKALQKTMAKIVMQNKLLKLRFNILNNYANVTMTYHFYQKN